MSALEQISMISNLLKMGVFSNLQKCVTLLSAIMFGNLVLKKKKKNNKETKYPCHILIFLNFHQTLNYLHGTYFLTCAIYLFSFSWGRTVSYTHVKEF